MEIKTVWGVIFHTPTGFQYSLIFLGIILILTLFILIKYNQSLKNKKSHEAQLLLFKAKQLGLTNFQYKVLKGITEIVNVNKPYEIINKPEQFEKSIASFLNFINTTELRDNEKHNSLLDISRDIVITYEKIYNHAEIRKPLIAFSDIVHDKLVYFITQQKDIFIGKLTHDSDSNLIINVINGKQKITAETLQSEIEVHLWRSGDAEYSFNTVIQKIEENFLYIPEPQDLIRKNAVRTPFVDVIIPCDIFFKAEKTDENNRKFQTTIFKLNENEFVIRTKNKLNFNISYEIEFLLNDFKIISNAIIIADRTISQENIFYYTFKFQNISEAAKAIILKYITDRL
ncbi:MAG: hypothetical protein JW982_04135 [Spirochaetes bacterium]|nr:hypothetical protein [Spirochaetota bacterium]